MREQANWWQRSRCLVALLALGWVAFAGDGAAIAEDNVTGTAAAASAANEAKPIAASRMTMPQATAASPLDRRIRLLAAELDLDAAQQAEVRKILLRQRADVLAVWLDEAVPPAVKVVSTQAIGDRTADQIRALLTDEQRTKYTQPRRREGAEDIRSADVETWMSGPAKTVPSWR